MSQHPLPVIALEYAEPAHAVSTTWRWVVFIAHWVALVSCTAGVVVIGAVTTRFGVLVALIIAPAGLLLIVGGAANRDRKAIALGVGHFGICLLFFSLVNLLSWGPDAAHKPMTVMGSLYTLVVWCLALRWNALRLNKSRAS